MERILYTHFGTLDKSKDYTLRPIIDLIKGGEYDVVIYGNQSEYKVSWYEGYLNYGQEFTGDELLNELGWIVIRFSAKKIISDLDECIKIVTSHIIDGLNKPYDVCGVYLYNDIKNIKIIADRFKKCKCGNIIEKKTNMCRVCDAKNQRKVQRPPYEQLLLEVGEIGYVATGKKYGVSDNSIRKWIRMYKKYGENF
jgi:hypothetical protein